MCFIVEFFFISSFLGFRVTSKISGVPIVALLVLHYHYPVSRITKDVHYPNCIPHVWPIGITVDIYLTGGRLRR